MPVSLDRLSRPSGYGEGLCRGFWVKLAERLLVKFSVWHYDNCLIRNRGMNVEQLAFSFRKLGLRVVRLISVRRSSLNSSWCRKQRIYYRSNGVARYRLLRLSLQMQGRRTAVAVV